MTTATAAAESRNLNGIAGQVNGQQIEHQLQKQPIQTSNTGEFQLSADPSKYVTLPVQNEAIWRKYQTTLDTFWTVYEVNVERDKQVAHNTIVTKELFLDLINHVDIKEASYYFSSQADSKKTHSLMYSMLLDELIEADICDDGETKDEDKFTEKKAQLMSDVANLPEVRQLLRWYVEKINLEQESFAKRMYALATLQGVIFAVPFMMFSWLEKQYPSKLNGLTKSNQLIWRDEKLNLSFSCMLFDYIDDAIQPETAANFVQETAMFAKNLFTNALPVSKLGISCESISQFIDHAADSILINTNHERIFRIEKTPFDWIVEPNFETTKQVDIPTISTTNDSTTSRASFGLDEDF